MSIAGTPFFKMHGLGNDFMVVDARKHPFRPTPGQVRALANRNTGIGFDQLVTIEPPRKGGVAHMGIRNADGSLVENCGNAARCVGKLLLAETRTESLTLEIINGLLQVERAAEGQVRVDMGLPRLDWREIPLSREADVLELPISVGPLDGPVAVSMGNPHAVFFVPDVHAIDLAAVGPLIEHDPLFPNRTNVEVVTVQENGALRMRVWERGTGITRACGTGACAAYVAACMRGLVSRSGPTPVILDGGTLMLEERPTDGHILMTGAATTAFSGVTLNAGRPEEPDPDAGQ
ncbi:diaminopimelate epimerase [Phaeovibrio sulfidiphilus]|uniref:Diaminopimelate epimerase n=1 Tax=Phaeovibrio sulfidiphilus TaxID=1220600 RepID=A0A8J6YZ17_9PROT|nr:diaminopimelate epimerase [Phaeovibrio sulfidiphilus]MBE1237163.1 diaminopimelate epimerase [Phaeovibrio sulfidiphilus]